MLQTGDVVTLFGREEPEFSFGDSMTSRLLKMTVSRHAPHTQAAQLASAAPRLLTRLSHQITAYSVKEDWIMGEVRLTHQYDSPTVSMCLHHLHESHR